MSKIVALDGTNVSYLHTQGAMDAAARARSKWADSRDALLIAEDIRRKAFDLLQHGDALLDHPGDPQIRAAARADARKYITLCDDLERLS